MNTLTVTGALGAIGGGALACDASAAVGLGNGALFMTDEPRRAWLPPAGIARTVFRQLFVAWRNRLTAVGAIKLEESTERISRNLTFTLADPTVAHGHLYSIAAGQVDARLTVVARSIGEEGGRDAWLAFVGMTDAASNEGAWRPVAQFRAVGEEAAIADTVGCVSLDPFSNMRRLEIVTAMALNAGVILEFPPDLESGWVLRPMEMSGLTVEQLMRRFALIEGWGLRQKNGSIEVVPEKDYLTGPPRFKFKPSNYFSLREEPPQNPITRVVLSGACITSKLIGEMTVRLERAEQLEDGIDDDGNEWEKRTHTFTIDGTEVGVGVSERAFAADPGETTPATYRASRSTLKTREYVTVIIMLTNEYRRRVEKAMVTSRLSEEREYIAEQYWPQCMDTYVDAVQGTDGIWRDPTVARISKLRHVMSMARLAVTTSAPLPVAPVIVQEKITRYTWGAAAEACRLKKKVVEVKAWRSLLGKTGGVERLWTNDNKYHADTVETFRLVSRETTTIADNLFPRRGRREIKHVITEEGYVRSGSFGHTEHDLSVTVHPIETWGTTKITTKQWSGIVGSKKHEYREEWVTHDGQRYTLRRQEQVEIPDPEVASGAVPQWSSDAMLLTMDALTDRYPLRTEVLTIDDAESMAELKAVGLRLLRDGLSSRVVIVHPSNPGLKLFDRVTVTDPTRYLNEAPGWVIAISHSFNIGARQTTTVILPNPEVDLEL